MYAYMYFSGVDKPGVRGGNHIKAMTKTKLCTTSWVQTLILTVACNLTLEIPM